MPDILTLAKQYRSALEKQDAIALRRLIEAYGNLYARLESQVELLARDIVDNELTRGQVASYGRYKTLQRQLLEELTRYQGYLGTEIETVSGLSVARGVSDSAGLMKAAANLAGIEARFNRVPVGAIKSLLGFLDRDGPLFARLEKFAGTNAKSVANTILELVGIGKNPRAIASAIQDSLGGGLTDALRMTRTVQLYSYRESTRANYSANEDIVTGWQWYAELDDSTCASCVAMHGSIHPNSESLNDHHNGRCAMLPVVQGAAPVDSTGRDWFDGLTETEQRNLLGKGRYEAFKAGRFEFEGLSTTRTDDVYGEMRVQATLKELA